MGVKYSYSIGQNVFKGFVIEENGTVLVFVDKTPTLFKLESGVGVLSIFLNKLNRLLMSESVADVGT